MESSINRAQLRGCCAGKNDYILKGTSTYEGKTCINLPECVRSSLDVQRVNCIRSIARSVHGPLGNYVRKQL